MYTVIFYRLSDYTIAYISDDFFDFYSALKWAEEHVNWDTQVYEITEM